MTRHHNFEQALKGLLVDPRSDERALRRGLRRLPAVGPAEVLVLRETGIRLINDVSVEATWPLLRLRGLTLALAMRDPGAATGLAVVAHEIELAGTGPLGTPVDTLNHRGCVLAEHDRFRAAVAHFSAALDADPGFVPARVNRARCSLELGRTGEARADAAEALRRDPGHPPARHTDRLVRTLLALADDSPLPMGLLAAAHGLRVQLRTYDRPARPGEVRRGDPWDEEPFTPPPEPPVSATAAELIHYGVVSGRIGRYAEAAHAFEAALVKDPRDKRARYNLAKAHQMAGDHERALAELRRLKNPSAEARALRARSLRALWRIEEARAEDAAVDGAARRRFRSRTPAPPDLPDLSELLRALARQPVALEPWSREEVESALSQLTRLSARGRHDVALRLLVRKAQRPAPTVTLRARLHERHAVALAGLGRRAKAREQYSAALALLPEGSADDVRTRCLEGRAACAADHAGKARTEDLHAALTAALRTADRSAEARLRTSLGRAARAAGRPHAAAAWYRSVLEPAREAEDWRTEIGALRECVALAERLGRAEEARAYGERLGSARRAAGDLALTVDGDVDAVVRAARRTLLARAPGRPAVTGGGREDLEALLDHADRLRGTEGRPGDALACYYPALAVCLQREDPDDTTRCLTGMGAAYETLACRATEQAIGGLVAALREGLHESVPWGLRGTLTDAARALTGGEPGELTACARAAFRWALALAGGRGDQVAQATALSNLAMTEARLGNLDTAARYERWALGVHLRAEAHAHARITLGRLALIAERLGDEEGAAALRRRQEGLGRGEED
ncbi:tetratricopeptide repeat protein [Streptomyces sp. NPDC016309]|uniref:tetratricopeptide repeat protein n=1 Tax=Streptomyces sp. NPDC016309 TaxID=3364965 RepID=UPI0036F71B22